MQLCPQYFHRALEGRAIACATTADCPSCSDSTAAVEYFRDNDADGFGSGVAAFTACQGGFPAFASQGGDCEDFNTNVGPGVVEICTNGIDDDCDGLVDNCVSTPSPTDSTGVWILDTKSNASNLVANCHEVCGAHGKQCSEDGMQQLIGANQAETLLNCQHALSEAYKEECSSVDDDYVYGGSYEALGGGIFQYAGAYGFAHCACSRGVKQEVTASANVTLTMNGPNPYVLDALSNSTSNPFAYTDPGAQCQDVAGFNLTDRILTTGQAVNLATIGTYVHVYTCCNDAGECASKERRIIVEQQSACADMSMAMNNVAIAYDATLFGGCVFYQDFHVAMTNSFTVVPPPPARMYFLGGESSSGRPSDSSILYTDTMGNVTAQGDCGERPENPDDRRVCYCV